MRENGSGARSLCARDFNVIGAEQEKQQIRFNIVT